MATITKLALTQANTALANDNAALRALVGQLTINLEIARAELASTPSPARANKAARPQRPAYVAPQWQLDRAAAMAAARTAAMASNHIARADFASL